jgi:hypothetical protein
MSYLYNGLDPVAKERQHQMSTTTREKQTEELRIFVERFVQFMNLWTVYSDMLTGRYTPSVGQIYWGEASKEFDAAEWPVNISMMLVLYAYFYSLIEDSDDGLNGFRVWREVWPNEEVAISSVEKRVVPFRDRLRVYRNRLGFHGSRTRTHEAKAFELFSKHSGNEIFEAMKLFKVLGAGLLGMDRAVRAKDRQEEARFRKWIDEVATAPKVGLAVR